MQLGVIEETALKIASFKGMEVFQIHSGKFKTNSINIFFLDTLSPENVTKNALIPAILRRGCRRFPSFREIALYLEELYGASFDCGIAKKGEQQVIHFYMEFISDRYTGEDARLFERASDLLLEIITEPVLDGVTFRKDYLRQEKDNLRRLIEGRINDKMQYSSERCFEEMCREEPFGIYEYGNTDDLDKIDESVLFDQYKTMLASYPAKVFISGDVGPDKAGLLVQKLTGIKRKAVKRIEAANVKKDIGEVRNVTEKMDVNQGKLALGFMTSTCSKDPDYYSLMVYNGILGGGTHSKLFRNVREKASLAYYVFSRLDKFKGLMLVGSGIEPENKDLAEGIIMEQLEEMRKGNISAEEFDATLLTIETGIRSLRDSQLQMVDFYLSQAISGTCDTFDSLLEKIKAVSVSDVARVAGKVRLDTVYFLAPA